MKIELELTEREINLILFALGSEHLQMLKLAARGHGELGGRPGGADVFMSEAADLAHLTRLIEGAWRAAVVRSGP